MRNVTEIYKKINSEIEKAQKSDKSLEYLERAKSAIEFSVAWESGKGDDKWKGISNKTKEEMLQMLISEGSLHS